MNRDEIKGLIKNIISEIAPDEDVSKLSDAGVIREELDLDSMDFLDIMMELRKTYKINVPKEDYPQFGTLNSSADYLEPHLKDVPATTA